MLLVVIGAQVKAKVRNVANVFRPISTVGGTSDGEHELNHKDPEDGHVGRLHHLGHFICRFRRVHLNFSLMASVDNDAIHFLSVAQGHSTEGDVVVAQGHLNFVGALGHEQLAFLRVFEAAFKLIN